MTLTRNIPDLARPARVGEESEDLARAIEEAAGMVQAFVEQNAPAALDSLLGVVGDGPGGPVKGAANLAEALTAQTITLHEEVRRFLSVAPPK